MNIDNELDDPDNIRCPFCKSLILDVNSFEEEEICEHTILIATNEGGFEFIRDDLSGVISENFNGSLEDYLNNLPIESLVIENCWTYNSYYGFVNTK